MKAYRILAGAALIGACVAPGVAAAANAYSTGNVNSRAGPSVNFPRVTTLPAGVAVTIHGCLNNLGWCDTSWRGQRGWVSGRYLEYLYNDRRVLVEDYGRRMGIPIISFQFGNYWDRYYSDRPWYRDGPRWRERWQRDDWNWRDEDDPRRRRSAERDRDDDGGEFSRRRIEDEPQRRRSAERGRDNDEAEFNRRRVDDEVRTGSTRGSSEVSRRDQPRRQTDERRSNEDVPRGILKKDRDFCPPGLAKQGRCELQ